MLMLFVVSIIINTTPLLNIFDIIRTEHRKSTELVDKGTNLLLNCQQSIIKERQYKI